MSSLENLSTRLEEAEAPVVADRAQADKMFVDHAHYETIGRSALRAIRLALLCAGRSHVRTILDFACGHGRVLRYLRAAFPDAELWASDIDADALEYCAEHFGAHPVRASTDLTQIEFERRFDLIWVGSLLTHLPRAGWQAFAECTLAALERGGVLVFTTHGRAAAHAARNGEDYLLDELHVTAMLAEFERDGFAYRDYPGQSGYGVSFASPAWVARELQDLTALRLVGLSEAMWGAHQDVVAVQRV